MHYALLSSGKPRATLPVCDTNNRDQAKDIQIDGGWGANKADEDDKRVNGMKWNEPLNDCKKGVVLCNWEEVSFWSSGECSSSNAGKLTNGQQIYLIDHILLKFLTNSIH